MTIRILRHLLLTAAGGDGGAGGGGTGGEPATMEVDLGGGVKTVLPTAEAKKFIAHRDAQKQATREAAEKAGAAEQQRIAAEAARLKAEEDAKVADHAKKGELDQLRAVLTKGHTERETKITANLRDKALKAAVASAPKVAPTAIDDIVDQLRVRSRYDIDADAVVVLDSAGQPLKDDSGKLVQVDAFIATWLEKRPHYLLDGTPPGSGAASGAKGGGATRTITRKDYEAAQKNGDSATLTGIAKGQIRLVD